MNSTRMYQMFSSLGLAAILAAYIFLLLPFTIYNGNINEFTVSYTAIVKVYLPTVVFLVTALGLLGMLMPQRIYKLYAALLAAIGILFWVQSSLFVWDYGLLDGRAINWSHAAWRSWLELFFWGGGLLLVLVFHRRIGSQLIKAAILLFVLQFLLFSSNWVGQSPDLTEKTVDGSSNQSFDELYQFSSQKNVLHIIADGFQSDIFEDIITDGEQGEKISSALDGFTFYRDQLGAFPYTHMSMPAILSGKIYRNHIPVNEFITSTFSNKTILNAAYDAGYDVDLVVPSSLSYMYKKGRYTKLSRVPGQTHISEKEYENQAAAKLLDLSLFRLSPHIFKKMIYNDQLWFLQSYLTDKKYMGLQYFADKAFLRKLHENISIERRQPVYKYLHLMLSHNPMVTNESCEYAGRVLPTVRETVRNQAGCALVEILNLFEAMKRNGIYDDTLIILMADHGAWVPPRGMSGKVSKDGKNVEVINPQIMALSQPLLAIKRPGESGMLRTSDAPVSILDVAATIADVMSLETEFDGLSILSPDMYGVRARQYFVYQYQRSEWTDQYLSPIQEFNIVGKGTNSSSWHEGDIYLPGGIVRKSQGKSPLWQRVKVQE